MRLRLFRTVSINFMCSAVYYGLTLNVANLETNLYINVLINAVAEMPAFILMAVFYFDGRVIGQTWEEAVEDWNAMVKWAFFCILGSLLRGDGRWKVVKMVCGVLGIFGMGGTYNLFIYTVLFPTMVRNAALGCATQAAQMRAILAPFVVVLGGGLPFAVMGCVGCRGCSYVLLAQDVEPAIV